MGRPIAFASSRSQDARGRRSISYNVCRGADLTHRVPTAATIFSRIFSSGSAPVPAFMLSTRCCTRLVAGVAQVAAGGAGGPLGEIWAPLSPPAPAGPGGGGRARARLEGSPPADGGGA